MAKGTKRILALIVGGVALTYCVWPSKPKTVAISEPVKQTLELEQAPVVQAPLVASSQEVPDVLSSLSDDSFLPNDVEHMQELFQVYSAFSPLVQTLSYSGKVDWLSGRAAYLGDYASHYKTSKHFISRSLHGIGEYLSDVVSKGDRFNVLRTDKDIEFHLVLDLSRLKMWVYAYDATQHQRFLLKSYKVAAGKRSSELASGCLTPTGVFSLGQEIAVYKEGSMGFRYQKKIEMMTVFGQRWIPLSCELTQCSGPCKGLGIHGMPGIVIRKQDDG